MEHDFTTAQYDSFLEMALRRYRFVSFDEADAAGTVVLWRHDIDFSPQRALAMARIEAARGIRATYYVQLASRYYNALEPEVGAALHEVARLGHAIGVHFDPSAVPRLGVAEYPERIAFEARVLEQVVEVPVGTFSLHNPTTMVGAGMDALAYNGMLNASASSWRERFAYCSDSNGLWKYRRLDDMLQDESIQRLYVLTHPEWWTDAPMAPRQRIQRCIDGRKAWSEKYYDELLAANNRPNVMGKEI